MVSVAVVDKGGSPPALLLEPKLFSGDLSAATVNLETSSAKLLTDIVFLESIDCLGVGLSFTEVLLCCVDVDVEGDAGAGEGVDVSVVVVGVCCFSDDEVPNFNLFLNLNINSNKYLWLICIL